MVPSSSSRITKSLFMLTNGSKLLFVLTAVLISSSLLATGSSVRTHRNRISSPCSGGSRSLVFESAHEVGQEPEMSPTEISRTFDQLAIKTNKLKKRVRDLKNEYVTKRFRDTRVVNELDQVGLRLNGMPSTEPATVSSMGNAQAVSTVHDAFTDLAKVSVFIDQARMGEELNDHGQDNFEEHFAKIEDNHEEGLYLILCSLHRVTVAVRSPVTRDMFNEILALKVTEVDRSALRHTRDYLVLRDFEKILERLVVHFLALKDFHAS